MKKNTKLEEKTSTSALWALQLPRYFNWTTNWGLLTILRQPLAFNMVIPKPGLCCSNVPPLTYQGHQVCRIWQDGTVFAQMADAFTSNASSPCCSNRQILNSLGALIWQAPSFLVCNLNLVSSYERSKGNQMTGVVWIQGHRLTLLNSSSSCFLPSAQHFGLVVLLYTILNSWWPHRTRFQQEHTEQVCLD